MAVMINPAVMMHANADAHRTNMHAHPVETDSSPNGADVRSDARVAPAVATRVIYADAANNRARLGRHERHRGSREAQSENYLFHV